jgi:hypothetical protein
MLNQKAKHTTAPRIGTPVPVTVQDMEVLVSATPGSRTTASVARLRASHHNIARLIAWGLDHKRVAAMTGYSPQRVGQLAEAPAMKELIASYKEKVEDKQEEAIDAYMLLKAQNMIAAERHISDHFEELDEAGELMPVKVALAVSADAADRLGYSKRSQVTHNHEFASALEKAIARSRKVIDITPAAAIEPPQRGPVLNPPRVPNSDVGRPQQILIKRRA